MTFSFQITCVVGLYIWCAASDPADRGVFRSKKYLKIPENGKFPLSKETKDGCGSDTGGAKSRDGTCIQDPENETNKKLESSKRSSLLRLLCSPCALLCSCCGGREESSEQMSEDGMFYCSLCEVEVRGTFINTDLLVLIFLLIGFGVFLFHGLISRKICICSRLIIV